MTGASNGLLWTPWLLSTRLSACFVGLDTTFSEDVPKMGMTSLTGTRQAPSRRGTVRTTVEMHNLAAGWRQ